jgi:diguanylate cyclase (GGDEF)-like protein/PAS domain S-box-containing protein
MVPGIKKSPRTTRALEAACMSVWQATAVHGQLDDGDVIWTGAASKILGNQESAVRQKYRDFLKMVHPDDRQHVREAQQGAVDALTEYQVEFRIRSADTATRWLCIKARVETDQNAHATQTLGIVWDITEQKRPHETFALAIDVAKMAVWESDVASGKVSWSSQGAALLGLDPVPFVSSFDDFLGYVHPQDTARVWQTIQTAVQMGETYELEYRVIWPDKTVHWIAAKGHVYSNAYGQAERTLGILSDITLSKKAEIALAEQKDLAEITLQSIGDAVITTDTLGIVGQLNRAAEDLTGWPADAAMGKPIQDVVHMINEETGHPVENLVMKCLASGRAVATPADTILVSRDGRHIPVTDSVAPIYSHESNVLGTVIVLHDISHEHQLRHELSWQAAHDALTGLINRREFEVQLAEALAGMQATRDVHALLFMDLDQFKLVNDLCGHGAGDELLRQLAGVLQSVVRGSDTLARLGGDEMALLLRNCPLEQARYFAEKLRQTVADFHFFWNKQRFEISVSIGLVEVSAESVSITEIMAAADRACYVAKELGRDRVHVFEKSDAALVQRHREMMWVSQLQRALERGHFQLYIQPIVGLSDGAHAHAEVLLRMVGEDGKLIPPGAFIPAAERYNLMPAIDRWVIEACFTHLRKQHATVPPQAGAHPRAGLPGCVSINLSGISLNDDGLLEFIAQQLETHAVSPRQICFEITETAAIRNFPKARKFVDEVKKMGCLFSLDDFGTGLSSFSYLKNFPVDFLKIDGSFIRQLSVDKVDRAMVSSINEIGHVMGIRTIAEFVENEATLEIVRKLGIDFAQGLAVGKLELMH